MAPKTSVPTVEIHGFAMRAIREAKGRKVADLADVLEIHRSYIAHIENGSKRRISKPLYSAICNELGVEHRALLATAPERPEAGWPEDFDALADAS